MGPIWAVVLVRRTCSGMDYPAATVPSGNKHLLRHVVLHGLQRGYLLQHGAPPLPLTLCSLLISLWHFLPLLKPLPWLRDSAVPCGGSPRVQHEAALQPPPRAWAPTPNTARHTLSHFAKLCCVLPCFTSNSSIIVCIRITPKAWNTVESRH